MTAKEVCELMEKRGYTLMNETADKKILNFADINFDNPLRLHVMVMPEKDSLMLHTVIQPGCIKVSTDFFGSIESEEQFNKFKKFIERVLAKIYGL